MLSGVYDTYTNMEEDLPEAPDAEEDSVNHDSDTSTTSWLQSQRSSGLPGHLILLSSFPSPLAPSPP